MQAASNRTRPSPDVAESHACSTLGKKARKFVIRVARKHPASTERVKLKEVVPVGNIAIVTQVRGTRGQLAFNPHLDVESVIQQPTNDNPVQSEANKIIREFLNPR